ncbi:MAG: EthD domain-containing protein [Caulobacterales bacterium]
MIKMVVEVWKRPDMTDEQFSRRWLVEHGALVKKHAKAMGFVKYIQSHKVPSPAIDAFAEGRGWKQAPDGLTEVWWESMDSMNAAMGSPAGQAASAALEIDEKEFVDARKLSAFLAVEEVIFDFASS